MIVSLCKWVQLCIYDAWEPLQKIFHFSSSKIFPECAKCQNMKKFCLFTSYRFTLSFSSTTRTLRIQLNMYLIIMKDDSYLAKMIKKIVLVFHTYSLVFVNVSKNSWQCKKTLIKERSKQWIQNKPSRDGLWQHNVIHGGDILGFHFFKALNDNLEA